MKMLGLGSGMCIVSPKETGFSEEIGEKAEAKS